MIYKMRKIIKAKKLNYRERRAHRDNVFLSILWHALQFKKFAGKQEKRRMTRVFLEAVIYI